MSISHLIDPLGERQDVYCHNLNVSGTTNLVTEVGDDIEVKTLEVETKSTLGGQTVINSTAEDFQIISTDTLNPLVQNFVPLLNETMTVAFNRPGVPGGSNRSATISCSTNSLEIKTGYSGETGLPILLTADSAGGIRANQPIQYVDLVQQTTATSTVTWNGRAVLATFSNFTLAGNTTGLIQWSSTLFGSGTRVRATIISCGTAADASCVVYKGQNTSGLTRVIYLHNASATAATSPLVVLLEMISFTVI